MDVEENNDEKMSTPVGPNYNVRKKKRFKNIFDHIFFKHFAVSKDSVKKRSIRTRFGRASRCLGYGLALDRFAVPTAYIADGEGNV